MNSDKIKILIADDHHLVRKGFVALLNEMVEVEVVGESANGKEVIQLLKGGVRPKIILIDYEMPILNGLETLKLIKSDYFGIKVIILTMLQDKELVEACLKSNADGFLFKNISFDELKLAINKVANGEKYFNSEVALILSGQNESHMSGNNKLSTRELEIVKLVAEGKTSIEIGLILFISPRTVDTHRNNIMQKLELDSIPGLVRWAIKNKIIS
ncbi:MAG: response regulator transcription factor [Saprospiraceae bacterium]|nr:response regulator transcription factor [Saprospiraceae bacterium]